MRQRLIEFLLAISDSGSVRIALGLRADFYNHILTSAQLGSLVHQGQVTVLPLTREELREAIQGPVFALNRTFEGGLAERILSDVVGEPGNLPLLEFALTELWLRQNAQGFLQHQAYEEIGGSEKALATYAEEVYTGLGKADQQRARRLFLQLVWPGEATPDSRRLATRSEIGTDNWDLVDAV